MKNNYGSNRSRDTSPTAVASVPNARGMDVLVYRSVDATTGRALFHWKLGRRNRRGDGYYQTFRLEDGGVWDVLFAIQFLCAKFALVEECGMREELGELAQRLARLIAEMAVGKPVYGADDLNRQPPNGLATAFATPA